MTRSAVDPRDAPVPLGQLVPAATPRRARRLCDVTGIRIRAPRFIENRTGRVFPARRLVQTAKTMSTLRRAASTEGRFAALAVTAYYCGLVSLHLYVEDDDQIRNRHADHGDG